MAPHACVFDKFVNSSSKTAAGGCCSTYAEALVRDCRFPLPPPPAGVGTQVCRRAPGVESDCTPWRSIRRGGGRMIPL